MDNDIPFEDSEALEAYCMPFIRGEAKPQTAAQLMASRYVAYTLAEVDYILATHDPSTRAQADREATAAWARSADWSGLRLLDVKGGGPDDDEGEVEFIANYYVGDRERAHHERSQFRKVDGKWYFVNGQRIGGTPQRREAPKVGRNDPCPCGSGKKHKKCCGRAA